MPMNRLDLPLSALSLALIAVPACGGGGASDSGDDAIAEEGSTTDPDPGTTGGDEPDESSTGGDPIDPDDPLAVCRALPGASEWTAGEPVVSIAESTDARIAAAGAQTWSLALELMRVVELADAPSVASSPASMYAAMGLSYGRWQGGQCGDRIAEVMAFPETGDDLHNTLGASLRELESRALEASDGADPVAISLRQSVWDFSGELSAPSAMMELYGADQNALVTPDEDARELINCVIEVQSQGLLPDFLPPGNPQGDTSSYDINVAFLQAPWSSSMDERTLQFTFVDGSTAMLDGFGSSLAEVQLYEGEAFTSVELPLRGSQLRVLAVVPPAGAPGEIKAFADMLDAGALATARDEARSAIVDLTMPKVQIEGQTLDYNEGRLDFQCEPFTLRAAFHGAAVELDHKGIKAAAASVNEGWSDGGEPEPELELTIDRPFLFFVYDAATQYVLYSGRYAPEQGG